MVFVVQKRGYCCAAALFPLFFLCFFAKASPVSTTGLTIKANATTIAIEAKRSFVFFFGFEYALFIHSFTTMEKPDGICQLTAIL